MIPATPALSNVVLKILIELLSTVALAAKQIKQGRFSRWPDDCISLIAELGAEKFAMKLMGDSEIEAVLQRLDRLTAEEARITVAQTLEVVHGLFNNLNVVLEGMQSPPHLVLEIDYTVI
jgi:hypothetical protein